MRIFVAPSPKKWGAQYVITALDYFAKKATIEEVLAITRLGAVQEVPAWCDRNGVKFTLYSPMRVQLRGHAFEVACLQIAHTRPSLAIVVNPKDAGIRAIDVMLEAGISTLKGRLKAGYGIQWRMISGAKNPKTSREVVPAV